MLLRFLPNRCSHCDVIAHVRYESSAGFKRVTLESLMKFVYPLFPPEHFFR